MHREYHAFYGSHPEGLDGVFGRIRESFHEMVDLMERARWNLARLNECLEAHRQAERRRSLRGVSVRTAERAAPRPTLRTTPGPVRWLRRQRGPPHRRRVAGARTVRRPRPRPRRASTKRSRNVSERTHEIVISIPIVPVDPPEGEGTDPIDYAEREERPLLAADPRIAEAATDFLETLRGLGLGAGVRARLELREALVRRGRRMRDDERDAFVAGVLAAVAALGSQLEADHGLDEDQLVESLASLAGVDSAGYDELGDVVRGLNLVRGIDVEWTGATWFVGQPANEAARRDQASKPKPWGPRR